MLVKIGLILLIFMSCLGGLYYYFTLDIIQVSYTTNKCVKIIQGTDGKELTCSSYNKNSKYIFEYVE